jgi:hypothetical protein
MIELKSFERYRSMAQIAAPAVKIKLSDHLLSGQAAFGVCPLASTVSVPDSGVFWVLLVPYLTQGIVSILILFSVGLFVGQQSISVLGSPLLIADSDLGLVLFSISLLVFLNVLRIGRVIRIGIGSVFLRTRGVVFQAFFVNTMFAGRFKPVFRGRGLMKFGGWQFA